jgi:ferric-dicitrate binding protein FerR (iron transport regulator)
MRIDRDLALITNYLGNALTAQEEAEVERRLVDDELFFEKVAPVLRVSLIQMRTSARLAPSLAGPAVPVHRPPTPAVDLPAARAKRKRWINLAEERRGLVRVAAIVLMCVGSGGVAGFTTLQSAASDAMSDARLVSVPSAAKVYETGRGETRAIVLDDGSRVWLHSYSQFTARPSNSLWPATIATLKGEAVIEVARSTHPMFLGTAASGAALLAGTYAVRCERGCYELKLTVGTGHGWLMGATGTGFVYVWPGVRARAPEGADAERVHGYQYPEVKP